MVQACSRVHGFLQEETAVNEFNFYKQLRNHVRLVKPHVKIQVFKMTGKVRLRILKFL